MKSKNGIRYLELIFSVFNAKDCAVERGGKGISHGCRFVSRAEKELEQNVEQCHHLYKEIKRKNFSVAHSLLRSDEKRSTVI